MRPVRRGGALWPLPAIVWEVARLSSRPDEGLLSVTRGTAGRVEAHLVTLVYRVDDDGHDECRAWRVLQEPLGAVVATPSGTPTLRRLLPASYIEETGTTLSLWASGPRTSAR